MRQPHHRLARLAVAVTALVLAGPAASQAADVNHDRLPDRWERAHHLSLRVDQRARDQDHDGLKNLGEFRDHTDPRRADSDRDGVSDAREDADGDGTSNLTEQRLGSDGASTQAPVGDGEGSTANRYDHVLAYTPQDGVRGTLVLTRADGSTVAATFTPATDLQCAVALPGPFSPCDPARLVPGAKVAIARHAATDAGEAWTMVWLLVPAAAPVTGPAPVPAPAVSGTIASFAAGLLTVDRPNGFEHPVGPLAAAVAITCVHVHAGLATSTTACGPDALVPGRQVGATQLAVIDGVLRWTRVDILIPE